MSGCLVILALSRLHKTNTALHVKQPAVIFSLSPSRVVLCSREHRGQTEDCECGHA